MMKVRIGRFGSMPATLPAFFLFLTPLISGCTSNAILRDMDVAQLDLVRHVDVEILRNACWRVMATYTNKNGVSIENVEGQQLGAVWSDVQKAWGDKQNVMDMMEVWSEFGTNAQHVVIECKKLPVVLLVASQHYIADTNYGARFANMLSSHSRYLTNCVWLIRHDFPINRQEYFR